MRKKVFVVLFLLLITAISGFGLSACDSYNEDLNTLRFKTLSAKGSTVTGQTENSRKIFNFLNEIETGFGIKYKVSLDVYGSMLVESKMVELNEGDNVFYVLTYRNDEIIYNYVVTIHRAKMFNVTFKTAENKTAIVQQVEEGKYVKEPADPQKDGYVFLYWDYSFLTPVSSDITIYAKWEPKRNIPYKEEYYLENSDTGVYSLYRTERLQGVTDSVVTYVGKNIEGYVVDTEKGVLSGKVLADGSLVLKIYYMVKRLNVLFNENGGTYKEGFPNQTVKYGESVVAPVFARNGYALKWDKPFNEIKEDTVINAIWVKASEGLSYSYSDGVCFVGVSSCEDETVFFPSFYNDTPVAEIKDVARVLPYNPENVTAICLPDTIRAIGETTLSEFINLAEINYYGTKAQWKAVYKENGWDKDIPLTTVHCYDGDVAVK